MSCKQLCTIQGCQSAWNEARTRHPWSQGSLRAPTWPLARIFFSSAEDFFKLEENKPNKKQLFLMSGPFHSVRQSEAARNRGSSWLHILKRLDLKGKVRGASVRAAKLQTAGMKKQWAVKKNQCIFHLSNAAGLDTWLYSPVRHNLLFTSSTRENLKKVLSHVRHFKKQKNKAHIQFSGAMTCFRAPQGIIPQEFLWMSAQGCAASDAPLPPLPTDWSRGSRRAQFLIQESQIVPKSLREVQLSMCTHSRSICWIPVLFQENLLPRQHNKTTHINFF